MVPGENIQDVGETADMGTIIGSMAVTQREIEDPAAEVNEILDSLGQGRLKRVLVIDRISGMRALLHHLPVVDPELWPPVIRLVTSLHVAI
ncbi:hypothetical protein D3C81_1856160 [compost metagenome]